ncbi:MAG: DJ-1/PfpI/YhbO family deglycase/protease [Desulfobacterales bacterium]|nr:DJ-1/PfpI/YhbO family deglycase/protease [Desulfobacterales bacterium]
MSKILIIAGDASATSHLIYAPARLQEEGFDVTIAAPVKKQLNTVIHERQEGWDTYIEKPGYILQADALLDEIDPAAFDALILPGGRAPEYLRTIRRCIEVVRHFIENDKPIAAICHGPQILLAAGLKGKRLAGLHLIEPDVVAAGCTYVKERGAKAIVDGNIVTAWIRPDMAIWMRAFLALLKQRGIKA